MTVIVVGLICGVICALIASNKGRSAIGWFFVGFLIGIFGLILILVLSNKKHEAEVLRQAQDEQRRLREQLLQEKVKSEAFRQHAALRFDAHDQALGVDTRSTPALPGTGPDALSAPDPPTPPLTPSAGLDGRTWFYASNGMAIGPVTELDIRAMLGSGKLTRQSLLYSQGTGSWKPLEQVALFAY